MLLATHGDATNRNATTTMLVQRRHYCCRPTKQPSTPKHWKLCLMDSYRFVAAVAAEVVVVVDVAYADAATVAAAVVAVVNDAVKASCQYSMKAAAENAVSYQRHKRCWYLCAKAGRRVLFSSLVTQKQN